VKPGQSVVAACVLAVFTSTSAFAAPTDPRQVMHDWYGFVIELVRHTPTYSPPVAARAHAYLGVAMYEAVASGSDDMVSLAGQLKDLHPLPDREAGKNYDEAVVLNATLAAFTRDFFANTGPTGQRAMKAFEKKYSTRVSADIAPDVLERSAAHGQAIAATIFAWSKTDGGAEIEHLGFPEDFKMKVGPEYWVPTSTISFQQKPLLPEWGSVRTFAIPKITDCALKPPLAYSEDKDSPFYKQALEVYDTSMTMTDDQRTLARFWSDDPMLTPTPAGHGMTIVLQVLDTEKADLEKSVDVIARMGVTQADAMIGAWYGKYTYNRLRPVSYIRRAIDPDWESLLITPPFPDYPSGHSVQSGTLGVVMTKEFGDNYAFTDRTGVADGLKPRSFKSFWEAANEAGMSRLYGGIHYRAAIENGLAYGACIGEYTNALKTRK
jgi:hypothetical protein